MTTHTYSPRSIARAGATAPECAAWVPVANEAGGSGLSPPLFVPRRPLLLLLLLDPLM